MRQGQAVVSVVCGLLLVGGAEGRELAPVPAGPALDRATLAEVRELQDRRREVLRAALETREKLYQAGRAEMGGVIDTSKRLLAVELGLAATAAERVAAYEKHLEKMLGLIEIAKAKRLAARGNYSDVLDAQDAYLEARIGLLKAGGKPKKAEK